MFKLPAYSVVMLFDVPASVSAPPLSEPLILVAPKTATVPSVRLPTVKPPLKVETPAPANVLIATLEVPLEKSNVPAFVTAPNEPTDVVSASLLKVAVPPVPIVNPLPPFNSVLTVRDPEPTFNVPV